MYKLRDLNSDPRTVNKLIEKKLVIAFILMYYTFFLSKSGYSRKQFLLLAVGVSFVRTLLSLDNTNIFLLNVYVYFLQLGIGYLHRSETNRPAIVHKSISVKNILLDEQFKPIITDSGLQKLLVDDIIFSTLKVSASLGYMAPEYITTGGCTEKSDVYAFGVIMLQILSGKTYLNSSIRLAAESGRYEEFIDANLKGKFSKTEAAILTKIAVISTDELPDSRPTMKTVIQDLGNLGSVTL